MSRLLFISFIDFGEMESGSSVRPQKMCGAFRELDYEVDLLSGLQNRRAQRWKNVLKKIREVRLNPPDFCYVEPPSGPLFNFCDHMLLLTLKRKNVPVGLFYRDAYWLFAQWWQVKGLKKFFLTKMQCFDLNLFKKCCKVIFFPTRSMADLFDVSPARKAVLPPAGENRLGREGETPLFHRAVYVGGVSRRYGTDMMLKAFEILNEKQGRRISLTVVCREKNEIFKGYENRPWLTVTKASGDRELEPIYRAADAAVYPGRRDVYMDFAMPVKIFEYISYGLPVVTTDCHEAALFIKKSGAGLVAEDNAESLAFQVACLYDEPGLIAKLKERAAAALLEDNLWTHRASCAAKEILSESGD